VSASERELQALVAGLREAHGVRSKQRIRPVARALGAVNADIRNGDDAAVIPDEDGFSLLAAEGMQPRFVAQEPWFAGFCAVMTNVSDIAAMGGRARAIVDVVHGGDDDCHTRTMLDGLAAAQALFGVPIVGGHTGFSSAAPSLCAAVLGKARRLITSFDARPGQQVLACIDLRGGFRGDSLHFDAVSNRKAEDVRAQLELLPQLAEAGLVSAGKDISMAGLCGTLLMLCESSGCGAVLELDALPLPDVAGAEPLRWLQAFPSYGFLLAVEPRAVPEVIARFAAHGVRAAAIAELTAGSVLDLRQGAHVARYWDWAREPLMGFAAAGERHA
jgi:uncharacterized protein